MATSPSKTQASNAALDSNTSVYLPECIALDLGLAEATIQAPGRGGIPSARAFLSEEDADPEGPLHELLNESEFGEGDPLLVIVRGSPDDARLAKWRDAIWPRWHVVALYTQNGSRTKRRTMHGSADLGTASRSATVLAARRTNHVMSPAATVEKFDSNAQGWDGEPGKPGYPHFRWMRKFVADYGGPLAANSSILDFGCGAGWVGIEAAKQVAGATLCSFDPSPQMVRITGENAEREGVSNFTGRTGFGEAPPFPAEGEAQFDSVISSGVVSFSPDVEAWMDGLSRSVKPGGKLIVGDIHGNSFGFRRRRKRKPLLPVRELNAQDPTYIREGLEARGFVFHALSGYQLTWPIPEAMHVDATQWNGLLSSFFLLMNKGGAGLDQALNHALAPCFDSWVMSFSLPR
jgi:SAM-dependent methyltransferase